MKPCILRNDDNTIKQVSAPNGKPSKAYEALYNKFGDEQTALRAYANMYTPEFQAWFKDSKVVDENGEPKIVYLDKNNRNFDTFVLGENFKGLVPFVISSKNPSLDSNGNYQTSNPEQVKSINNDFEEEINFSPVQQTQTITTLALSDTQQLIQKKEKLYYLLKDTLKKINNSLDIIEKALAKGTVSKNEIDKKKKQYSTLVKFKKETEKKLEDYKTELVKLKANKDVNVITEVLLKDFDRLTELINKPNLTFGQFKEARLLADFFVSLQPNIDKPHPFFSKDQLYDKNGNLKIEPDLKKLFENLSKEAGAYTDKLIAKRNNLVQKAVNSNAKVKHAYKRELTEEEILKLDEGLKDTHWFDKLLLDVTSSCFSYNGILPQVAFNEMQISFEQNMARNYKRLSAIDKLKDDVETELKKLGYGLKFLKSPGVSYDLFKQKDQFGLQTGKLIGRYSTNFEESILNTENIFELEYNVAISKEDPNTRNLLVDKAANKRQQWYRENTIQLDLTKLPIYDDKDLIMFKQYFNEQDSEEYVKYLKSILSEKAYNELIEEQKFQLKRFIYKSKLMTESGEYTAQEYAEWNKINNPFIANDYFYKNTKINHESYSPNMSYNVMFPRKKKALVVESQEGLRFTDTDTELNYYDSNFETIENNKSLYNFHKEISNLLKDCRNSLPPDLQEQLDLNTIMSIDKAITELLFESKNPIDGFLKLGSRGFSTMKDAVTGKLVESTDANIDYDKVDDKFITNNKQEINTLAKTAKLLLEKELGFAITKFTKIYNDAEVKQQKDKIKKDIASLEKKLLDPSLTPEQRKKGNAILKSLRNKLKTKLLSYDDLLTNRPAIKILSDLLGVNETIDDIKNKLNNESVLLKNLIEKAAANEIVRQKSFDLPRLMKYYSTLVARYNASNEIKPLQDLLKEAYQNIKTTKSSEKSSSNSNKNALGEIENLRKNAIEQYDSFYERVILDKQGKPIKKMFEIVEISEENKIKRFFEILKAIASFKTFAVLNKQEKENKKKLEKVLAEDQKEKQQGGPGFLTDEKINEINDLIENMGTYWGLPTLIEGLLAYARFRGLGFSGEGGITNFLEAVISNNIISSLGYISYENYLRAVRISRQSAKKNITFGKAASEEALKVTMIMSKLNKVQDSANELQKSSNKGSYSKAAVYLNPYEINKRIEFLNQSTLIVGTLLDKKIKNNKGEEYSVFDALNSDGSLKPEFKTGFSNNNSEGLKNQENWELFRGDDFKVWTSQAEALINQAHGNYSTLRGMLIKDNLFGKMVMMFRTWWPMALQSRVGIEHENILLGKVGDRKWKGRWRSYTSPSAIINNTILGFATQEAVTTGITALGLGTVGSGLSAVIGASLALGIGFTVAQKALLNYSDKRNGKLRNVQGTVKTDMNALNESIFVIRTLLLKAIGMPINRMFGGYSKNNVIFSEQFMGDYKTKTNGTTFSEEDALNMNANMTEAAMLIQRLSILYILSAVISSGYAYLAGGDDEEDKELMKVIYEEEKFRPAYFNWLINKLQNLNTNVSSFIPLRAETAQDVVSLENLPVIKGAETIGSFGYNTLNKGLGMVAGIFNDEYADGLFEPDKILTGSTNEKFKSKFGKSAVNILPGIGRDIFGFLGENPESKYTKTYIKNPFDRIHQPEWVQIRKQSKLNKLKIEEFLVTQTDLNKTERDKILRKIDLEQDPYKKIRKMYEDYQFDINNKEAYKNIIEQRGKYTFTDYIVDNANKY